MKRRKLNPERGSVATEYVLVCAVLVVVVVFSVPVAMDLFQYAYQVFAAVVCSPWPAGM